MASSFQNSFQSNSNIIDMNKAPINNNSMFCNYQNVKGLTNNINIQNKYFMKNNLEEVKLDVILNNKKNEKKKEVNSNVVKNNDSYQVTPNDQILEKNFLKDSNKINQLLKDEFVQNKHIEKYANNFQNFDENNSQNHFSNNNNTISKYLLFKLSIRK